MLGGGCVRAVVLPLLRLTLKVLVFPEFEI